MKERRYELLKNEEPECRLFAAIFLQATFDLERDIYNNGQAAYVNEAIYNFTVDPNFEQIMMYAGITSPAYFKRLLQPGIEKAVRKLERFYDQNYRKVV